MIFDKVTEVLLRLDGLEIHEYGLNYTQPICHWGNCEVNEDLTILLFDNETNEIYFGCEMHLKQLLSRGWRMYE